MARRVQTRRHALLTSDGDMRRPLRRERLTADPPTFRRNRPRKRVLRQPLELAERVSLRLPTDLPGFTLYGTVDVGYGYDTAGVAFGKWYDKGVFYTIQKTSGGRPLVLVAGRLERFNPRCEDGGADWR